MPQAQTVALPSRWPLVATIQTRDAGFGKDSQLVNCYAEQDQTTGDWMVEKRPGTLAQSVIGGIGLGMYTWSKGGVFSVFGGHLYKDGVNLGVILGTSTSPSNFAETNGTPPYIVVGNTFNSYYTDGSTLTQITDPNFNSLKVPGWAYLDGTLYYMTIDGSIWGSLNLDDPTAWDPLNVIRADNEPSNAVALVKHHSFVVAFKKWDTEFFYDAGNPTGSPLSLVPGAEATYGCFSANSIQDIDGTLFWMTFNRSSSFQIARLDNLQVTIISTPAIERLINGAGVNVSTISSLSLRIVGHRFYVLTVQSKNVTVVYDIDQKQWYRWTDSAGNYWPIVARAYAANGQPLIQHATNGTLYYVDGDYTYPTDDGALTSVDIYTPNFDGGVDRRKQLNMMRFNADQTPGSLMFVRHSDDDYQTWSNFRQVNLANKRPILTGCGTFYRRAYHFRHTANTGFRIKSVDLQIDLGTL